MEKKKKLVKTKFHNKDVVRSKSTLEIVFISEGNDTVVGH